MRIRLTAASLLLAMIGAAVAFAQPSTSQDQPGLRWTDQQIKEVAFHVRAGRKLTPKTWPNGARVAVCLSVDPDNFSIALNAGNTNPVTISGGEYGALDRLPRRYEVCSKGNDRASWSCRITFTEMTIVS